MHVEIVVATDLSPAAEPVLDLAVRWAKQMQASIVLLVSCLRKMQCVQLAGKYIKSLCRMVEQEVMKTMKIEIIEKIKKQDG